MTTDQLPAEFEQFQGELRSFVLRMTGSVQDAEDIYLIDGHYPGGGRDPADIDPGQGADVQAQGEGV